MIAQKPVNLADVQKGLFGADAIIDETDGSLTFVDFLEDYGLNASSLGGSTGYKFLDERKVFRVDKIKPTKNSLSSGGSQICWLVTSFADSLMAFRFRRALPRSPGPCSCRSPCRPLPFVPPRLYPALAPQRCSR